MSTAERAAAVELDVVLTAELPMPQAYVMRPQAGRLAGLADLVRPGAETMRGLCLAFVVRHPTVGTIVVDTGFHANAAANPRDEFGTPMSLLFRKLRPSSQPFDEQLRALGVDPAAVELTVMTHLHVDHTSGMRLLPGSAFVAAREEWAAAMARRAELRGFIGHHLPPKSRMRLVDFEGEGKPHGPFERTIDLLDDGSIRLLSTPGHTPGHLSLLVRLAEGRQALLAGDAAYVTRNIDEQRPPLNTTDEGAYRRSLRALKAFADQNPDAPVVPSHDPTAWRALAGAQAASAASS